MWHHVSWKIYCCHKSLDQNKTWKLEKIFYACLRGVYCTDYQQKASAKVKYAKFRNWGYHAQCALHTTLLCRDITSSAEIWLWNGIFPLGGHFWNLQELISNTKGTFEPKTALSFPLKPQNVCKIYESWTVTLARTLNPRVRCAFGNIFSYFSFFVPTMYRIDCLIATTMVAFPQSQIYKT